MDRGRSLRTDHRAVEVRDVLQRAGLFSDGVSDDRMAVTETGDGESAQEVEIALAVDVPQLGALAADERHGLGRLRVHRRTHDVRIVPMPALVTPSGRR